MRGVCGKRGVRVVCVVSVVCVRGLSSLVLLAPVHIAAPQTLTQFIRQNSTAGLLWKRQDSETRVLERIVFLLSELCVCHLNCK